MNFDKNTPYNDLPKLPPMETFDDVEIWKEVAAASVAIAKLEGKTTTTLTNVSNSFLLMQNFTLPEAVASQEVEDVATTIEEALLGNALPEDELSQAQKETAHYTRTLVEGYVSLTRKAYMATNDFIELQSRLELSVKGLRSRPGYKIANRAGEVFYTPPEGEQLIRDLLQDFENYFNDSDTSPDPLIRMAILHYQFEAIHPFPDGNGRTGRILMPLYLVAQSKLTFPVLFLSPYILRNRSDYYRLLRAVTSGEAWPEWVSFILKGVTEQANSTLNALEAINEARSLAESRMPSRIPILRHQKLLDYLFTTPSFTQADLEKELNIHRNTAGSYLAALVNAKILSVQKVKRTNLYINIDFLQVLIKLKA
jgi:Fic family protein